MKIRLLTYILGISLMMPFLAAGQSSSQSDIVPTPGFVPPANINYLNYRGIGLVTMDLSNSLNVASFTIRDGGNTPDPDNFPTILNELRLKIDNVKFIHAMGITANGHIIQTVYPDPNGLIDTVNFTGLGISAPDDGTADVRIYVMYTQNVLDRFRNIYTVSSAIADPSGSGFAASNAGGAQSSTLGDDNKIDVVATKLEITTKPSETAYVNVKLQTPPVVTAQDINDVTDIDYGGLITLGNTAGIGMDNYAMNANLGQASFSNLDFNSTGTTKIYTMNAEGMSNDTSGNIVISVPPQKKWDGGAGTTSWYDAENWNPAGVPSPLDNVVLDHSYVTSTYTVILDQSVKGEAKTLTITPAVGFNIVLQIPSINIADTALMVYGNGISNGNTVTINDGGIIDNNSGSLNDVYSFAIGNGLLRIRSGGVYQHRTLDAHENLVKKLSTAFGTERGMFFFDVPGLLPYDVYVNNATYGSLTFERLAGAATYTGSGAGTLTIRGDLNVITPATFAPTVANIVIKGDLYASGVFDPAVNTWVIMDGEDGQIIGGNGTYLMNKLEMSNSSVDGVTLIRDVEMENLPGGEVKFTDGRLFTESSAILTVPENVITTGGSISSFIHGPVYKFFASTDRVEIPVGKDTFYRPVGLEPVSTNFTSFFIEYHRQNPDELGYDTSARDSSIKRVSSLEYWNITRTSDATPADAYVSLGWSTASGVTPGFENHLRVAYWNGFHWDDKGGNPIVGTADRGTVFSDPEVNGFGIFTLGSLSRLNPLPVELISFTGELIDGNAELDWETASEINNRGFEIERSINGNEWVYAGWKEGHGDHQGILHYDFVDYSVAQYHAPVIYYRLKQIDHNGQFAYSPVVAVKLQADNFTVQNSYINSRDGKLHVSMSSVEEGNINLMLTDVLGRIIYDNPVQVTKGANNLEVYLPDMPVGVTIMRLETGGQVYSQKLMNSR